MARFTTSSIYCNLLHRQSELLCASKWPEDKDPKGYWLSEKLDGVRAWWDGEKLWSRTGHAWNPPQWFLNRLPRDLFLDGELWMQRDAFDETSSICRMIDTHGWKRINYMVFDVTNLSLLYEERLSSLRKSLPDGEMTPDEVINDRSGSKVCVLPAVYCEGKVHLQKLMSEILDKGGEGLMLRQAHSAYEFKRSSTLYKLKYWYDAEGLVVDQGSTSYNKDKMGFVVMQMECGKTIEVSEGFTQHQRAAWQPSIGKVIRYRFQELSKNGLPRFAVYEGTTPDKLKARDAIVRSATFRANARAGDLDHFKLEFDSKVREPC
jgi:DNA ligase-1